MHPLTFSVATEGGAYHNPPLASPCDLACHASPAHHPELASPPVRSSTFAIFIPPLPSQSPRLGREKAYSQPQVLQIPPNIQNVAILTRLHQTFKQMSKKRRQIAVDPKEMAQNQIRMGYRGPSTEPYAMDDKDPEGEAAYQRAFAEAAKMKPPRLPNAAFFTNSPSAQEFIRRQDQGLFPQPRRETKPNITYDPPQSDVHRVARNALNSPPTNNHHAHPSPTNSNSSAGRHSTQQYHDSRLNGSQPPPLLMEPNSGPSGPDRKIR